MSDRELLELAAKAAGYGYGEWTRHGIVFAAKDAVWNPLDDDGDALRLSVKLGLTVQQLMTNKEAVASDYDGSFEMYEFHEADPLAATRRAIVRAAAEIGRNMK